MEVNYPNMNSHCPQLNTTPAESPLARLIQERGLRKGFVAAKLGMNPSRLSRVLAGAEMKASELADAVELFGVDMRELVPGGKR